MKTGYDKEAIYDEQIHPLMKQIIEICQAEEIPMMATFYLQSADVNVESEPLHCTTTLPFEGNTPDHYYKLNSLAYNCGEKVWTAAITITSK